jgi:hypothetical protein
MVASSPPPPPSPPSPPPPENPAAPAQASAAAVANPIADVQVSQLGAWLQKNKYEFTQFKKEIDQWNHDQTLLVDLQNNVDITQLNHDDRELYELALKNHKALGDHLLSLKNNNYKETPAIKNERVKLTEERHIVANKIIVRYNDILSLDKTYHKFKNMDLTTVSEQEKHMIKEFIRIFDMEVRLINEMLQWMGPKDQPKLNFHDKQKYQREIDLSQHVEHLQGPYQVHVDAPTGPSVNDVLEQIEEEEHLQSIRDIPPTNEKPKGLLNGALRSKIKKRIAPTLVSQAPSQGVIAPSTLQQELSNRDLDSNRSSSNVLQVTPQQMIFVPNIPFRPASNIPTRPMPQMPPRAEQPSRPNRAERGFFSNTSDDEYSDDAPYDIEYVGSGHLTGGGGKSREPGVGNRLKKHKAKKGHLIYGDQRTKHHRFFKSDILPKNKKKLDRKRDGRRTFQKALDLIEAKAHSTAAINTDKAKLGAGGFVSQPHDDSYGTGKLRYDPKTGLVVPKKTSKRYKDEYEKN